jgi:hypothetical protein
MKADRSASYKQAVQQESLITTNYIKWLTVAKYEHYTQYHIYPTLIKGFSFPHKSENPRVSKFSM